MDDGMPSMRPAGDLPAMRELTPAEHSARLARTYELARDLGAIAREMMAACGRADRAAHRQDIDLLAEASEMMADLNTRYARTYVSMMAVRVRPLPPEPFLRPLSDSPQGMSL